MLNIITRERQLRFYLKYFRGFKLDPEKNYQEKLEILLHRIMNIAISKTEYYRSFSHNLHDSDVISVLEQFPIVDKQMIKVSRNRHLAENIEKLPKYLMNTGGSTGEPFELWVSMYAGFADVIHQFQHFRNMKYRIGDRVVSFDGVQVPKSFRARNVFWLRRGGTRFSPYGYVRFSTIFLEPGNTKFYLRELENIRPQFIRGYPTAIREIADYIIDNGITLKWRPKGIQLTSERVPLDYMRRIGEAFRCDVCGQYGMSEAAVFGFSRPFEEKYYCSPLYGYVEVLNDEGQHVRVGESGEIVVTSFFSDPLPLIRYRTGDRAEYGGRKNGFTILNSLQGRTHDYILDRNGKKVFLIGLVFGSHIRAFRNIEKWQIEQEKIGEIIVRIRPSSSFSPDDAEEIEGLFVELARVKTKISITDDFILSASGKFLFMVRRKGAC